MKLTYKFYKKTKRRWKYRLVHASGFSVLPIDRKHTLLSLHRGMFYSEEPPEELWVTISQKIKS